MNVLMGTPKRRRTLMNPWCAWLLTMPLASISCGAPQEPPAGVQPSPEKREPATSEPAAPEPAEPSDTNDDSSTATDEVMDPAENDPNAIRDVVYKMIPGGLEIEVAGVKFLPKAEPVKLKGGAWGVKISMQAEGTGDSARHLLKPAGGVLAFAGTVKRKGKAEKFGDKRQGDETVSLAPGETLSFESTWPKDTTQNALWWGNELTLEAGLWGLGETPEGLRPVRQFFSLRMIAGNKPQPVLQPPKSAQ